MALAAVAVPWGLFLTIPIGSLAQAFAPADLWQGLWPVLLGAVLAVGLRRFGDRLPRLPEGDMVVLAEPLGRASVAFGASLERAEGVSWQWPVAGLSLLALVVILGAAILARPG
jgi:multicomponent Na+:H+ antiporter subunit A